MTAVRLITPSATALTPAAGYIRVSTFKQKDGFSPDIQREAIEKFAEQQGYDLVMMESDVQKGRVVSREGYQRLLDGVRAGVVHNVIVYMFDRWGRLGSEWIARAHELERAGVPFISVQEGKDEPGILRFVRAGMAEEYSRQLAKRVRPAKERSVRAGQHIGITPYGYKRVYPERIGGQDGSRYVAGLLVKDEATAWVAQEMFRRYAGGGWSLRALAHWLNTDPACPKKYSRRKGEQTRVVPWDICGVDYVLRNPVYLGRLRYNVHRAGYYETSAPGSAFVTEGRHEALIDVEVFDMVQARLDAANRAPVRTRSGRPAPLGAGLFVCAECGGPMAAVRRSDESSKRAQYTCRHRKEGTTSCRAPAYLMDLAHGALLAQVKRLQGRPWHADLAQAAIDLGAAPSSSSDVRGALERALDAANDEMKRHIRRFNALIEDPTPQEVAAHRAVGREISARIAALEGQVAALPAPAKGRSLRELEALHARLTQMDVAALIDRLTAQGDATGLRELALLVVASARVVERVPASKTKWVRVEVTWTAEVQLLIAAGQLTLGPGVQRPDYPATKKELQRERYLRYAARKKAGLVGVVPPARSGLAT